MLSGFRVLLTGAALALAAVGPAAAEDFRPKQAGDWMINLRVTDVAPDAGDAIVTSAGAPTGLKADVSDSYVPTIGITHFFTDHVAAELILGTSKHTIRAQGGSTDVKVHETWVLPPTLSLQYHFQPEKRFSPYVGAGVNYMLFYNGDDKNGFKVKLDDGFGYALQAGADIATSGPWSVNVDVKKIWFDTDAKINGGALKSNVNLDPWVVSVGAGYKF